MLAHQDHGANIEEEVACWVSQVSEDLGKHRPVIGAGRDDPKAVGLEERFDETEGVVPRERVLEYARVRGHAEELVEDPLR